MILSIAIKEWKLILKEKGTFFWLLLMPIGFIVLFGSVFGSIGKTTVTVPYIDLAGTAESQAFIKAIGERGGYKLEPKEAGALDEQITRIRDGKQSVLLVVREGFGRGLSGAPDGKSTVELYSDASSELTGPLKSVLENLANEYREAKIGSALQAAGVAETERSRLMESPLVIEEKPQNATNVNAITQVVPGYTVMFVFFVIISMIRRFIGDKTAGITARLQTTRMTPVSYLLGIWLAYLGVAIVQCAALLSFGHFAYGLELGDAVATAVLVLMLAICGTGLGLAICMLVRSENQGMAFTQLLTMGGAVLGGLWFPIEFMPRALQTVARFVPQYWAQKGFQDIMIRGAHLSGIWPSLAALAAFAAAGILVALFRYKGFMKSALSG
jgi:ABC-2 type transport system permease protein